ncbi:MAG: Nif11-like leader peptide family natural product precursor [Calothrix sp. C42_A2020_038]|nr:Nif11-like leader peptide family natural product precursor [Calothrix sp. C42_A2020_038]
MSMPEILEKVKDFLVKLVKDEAFRAKLMSEKVEEAEQFLQERGYNFSKEEFETAAIKILELKELGEFHELTEAELVGAVGGIASIAPEERFVPTHEIRPPSKWYPKPLPRPLPKPFPQPQPHYGIIITPFDPHVQALYGVIVSQDKL